jgi:hypothetical protein
MRRLVLVLAAAAACAGCESATEPCDVCPPNLAAIGAIEGALEIQDTVRLGDSADLHVVLRNTSRSETVPPDTVVVCLVDYDVGSCDTIPGYAMLLRAATPRLRPGASFTLTTRVHFDAEEIGGVPPNVLNVIACIHAFNSAEDPAFTYGCAWDAVTVIAGP